MPIYEYRCSSCGHQQEFMLKLSDPPLEICTRCGKPTFSKMVTAAGFQLKGSGWYATDFKSKGTAPAPAKESNDSKDSQDSKEGGAKKGGEKGGEKKGGDAAGDTPKGPASASGAGAGATCT